MASFKICLILVIGSLLRVDCVDYEQKQESRSSSRSTRDAKDNNDGYGSASANYNFQYAVNEGGTGAGNDFGHEEERNGQVTRGQYRVLLPDNRLQIVTYTADENGYRAEVTYENRGYSAPQPQPASNSDNNSGGYGSPQPKPAVVSPSITPSASQGYGAPPSGSSKSTNSGSSFGRRISGSFVKSRRNILGQNHNYNYSL